MSVLSTQCMHANADAPANRTAGHILLVSTAAHASKAIRNPRERPGAAPRSAAASAAPQAHRSRHPALQSWRAAAAGVPAPGPPGRGLLSARRPPPRGPAAQRALPGAPRRRLGALRRRRAAARAHPAAPPALPRASRVPQRPRAWTQRRRRTRRGCAGRARFGHSSSKVLLCLVRCGRTCGAEQLEARQACGWGVAQLHLREAQLTKPLGDCSAQWCTKQELQDQLGPAGRTALGRALWRVRPRTCIVCSPAAVPLAGAGVPEFPR